MIDYIYTNKPVKDAASDIAKDIQRHLDKGKRVLWLLSGGSSIKIGITAAKELETTDVSNLFISLTDERFGSIGHQDENWQQLIDGGFNLPKANFYRPLINKNVNKTSIEFSNWLKSRLIDCDYKLGIFGLGSDGHIAGIKPNSSAVTSTKLAASFMGDDFERITITFEAIKQLDCAVIQASGEDKKSIIKSLMTQSLALDNQPAQILKTVHSAILYTNNKEVK